MRTGNRGDLYRQVTARFIPTATAIVVAVFFEEFSPQKQFLPQRHRGHRGKAKEKYSGVKTNDLVMVRRCKKRTPQIHE
jgi:hypothetical protein